jgi:hypothetical protein
MDATITPPAAEIKAPSPAEVRSAGIKAWNQAATVEGKTAVVKQYPFLTEVYTLANELTPKK